MTRKQATDEAKRLFGDHVSTQVKRPYKGAYAPRPVSHPIVEFGVIIGAGRSWAEALDAAKATVAREAR